MYSDNAKRGAFFMLISSLLFAGMGVTIKMTAERLSNEMIVFFRNAAGLLALLPWLVHAGASHLFTRNWRLHLPRAIAGLGSMYCYFYALAHMPLAEAVLLNYSAPLFIPLVASLWLGEKIQKRLWRPLILGFVGIIFILKPGAGLFTTTALVALAAAVFGALAVVNIRRLTRTESATRIVFYFSCISTLVSAIPLTWAWQPPGPTLWGLLAATGVFATLGQLFLTRAYAHANAAQVAPFVYTIVVFAGIFGWILWRETPDVLSVLGTACICLAGVITLRYSRTATEIVVKH